MNLRNNLYENKDPLWKTEELIPTQLTTYNLTQGRSSLYYTAYRNVLTTVDRILGRKGDEKV